MGTKNVRLEEDVYERIRDEKRDDETFSDAVGRLIGGSSLLDLAGILSDEGAVARASAIEDMGTIQRVPANVVYELYVGVGYTEQPDLEVAKIQQVLDSRLIVETDEQIAKLAGRLDGQLRREGNRVSPTDILIGATARHFDEPVVTGTPSDFEPIPGVEMNTYRD